MRLRFGTAIFDAGQQLLIDSEGPVGNIGMPESGFEDVKHLRKMLTSTRSRLTDDEIESVLPK